MKNHNAVALGSLGGKASALKLTKEERIARAKKAVVAREVKRHMKPIKEAFIELEKVYTKAVKDDLPAF